MKARPARGRSVPLVAAAALMLSLGCSQFQKRQQAAPGPMLGASDEYAGDPYLAHHGPRRALGPMQTAPVEALAADTTRSTAHPLDAVSVADVETGTPVRLQAPEPLATPSNPMPALLASNSSIPTRSAVPPELDAPLALEPPKTAKPIAPAGPTADSVIQTARKNLNKIATYQVAMHRQERVNGNLSPEEDIVLSVRRNPKAVRLEWPSGSSKGREVIYSATENSGLMHVNMANAIVPMPRISMAPDSPMVLKNSRHPITEAGFDNIVAGLEDALKTAPGPNRVVYAGLETSPETGRPCHKLTRVGANGEQWVVLMDQASGLPAVVVGKDAKGDLLERYVFRDVKADLPDLAAAGAFDVNQRWGQGGFLSRLARAGGDAGRPAAANTSRQ